MNVALRIDYENCFLTSWFFGLATLKRYPAVKLQYDVILIQSCFCCFISLPFKFHVYQNTGNAP